jgi:hypothetical protein
MKTRVETGQTISEFEKGSGEKKASRPQPASLPFSSFRIKRGN